MRKWKNVIFIYKDDLTYEEKGSKLGFVSALLWSLRQQGSEKIVLVSISTQVLDLLAGQLLDHFHWWFFFHIIE
jgi:hypothetical protein